MFLNTNCFFNTNCIAGIIKKNEENLVNTIRELKPSRQEALLRCAVIWNTNSRNSQVAQVSLQLYKDNL